jgi:uncharacterized OB-fold protein
MSAESMIEIDGLNALYWAGLREGVLRYQACGCGHQWLPPRKVCPSCLGTQLEWRAASGRGTVKSWVVYHVAYHEEFKDRLPYNVAIVRLEEGPQLIVNIAAPLDAIRVGAPVVLSLDMKQPQPIARFELAN